MANKKNLANGILASSITSSATSMTLESGYGAGMPAVPFILTITPPGQLSTLGNSEIVGVTAKSGDTLTIVRAQKATTAKAFNAGAVVANGIYSDEIIGLTRTLAVTIRGNAPASISANTGTWYNALTEGGTPIEITFTSTESEFYVDYSMVMWSGTDSYKNVRLLIDGSASGITPSSWATSYLKNGVAPGSGTFKVVASPGTHTIRLQVQHELGSTQNIEYRNALVKAYEVVS